MSCSASSIGPVGNSVVVLARVVGVTQLVITQASLASISRTIYLHESGDILTGPTLLTISTVVSDTLLTTYGWDVDATGWNFKDVINGTLLTTAGALRIAYTLVDTNGVQTVVSFAYIANAVE